MTIPARFEQPCMAYCGHDIEIDDEIEEGPNGWQHYRCSGQQQRSRRQESVRVHQAQHRRPQTPDPSDEDLASLTDDERAIFDRIRARRPHQQPQSPVHDSAEF